MSVAMNFAEAVQYLIDHPDHKIGLAVNAGGIHQDTPYWWIDRNTGRIAMGGSSLMPTPSFRQYVPIIENFDPRTANHGDKLTIKWGASGVSQQCIFLGRLTGVERFLVEVISGGINAGWLELRDQQLAEGITATKGW